jgi:oligopeptide transport system ATP-binding protein
LSKQADRIILEIENLTKSFIKPRTFLARLKRRKPQDVKALNGINLSVTRGETLGVVGESGCGKSTLARCVVRLYKADSGRIVYDGIDVLSLTGDDLRRYNRRVQMIFQDPYSSLNPRMTVGQMLKEALAVHHLRSKKQIPARIHELLNLVHLPVEVENRLPYEFSGGQRQRIGIARALSVEPEFLLADELVSALDVSVQAQVVNLLLELQQNLHLTIIFVAHDLRLVRHVSHRVAVMYLGEVVELADTEQLFSNPMHPYTVALLAAAPNLDPSNRSLQDALGGELPSPLNIPAGCPFHPRCPQVFEKCHSEKPLLLNREENRILSCHLFQVTELIGRRK